MNSAAWMGTILLLYGLVGLGCGMAWIVLARSRTFEAEPSGFKAMSRTAGDGLLLLCFWPLYGPFLLTQSPGETHGAHGKEIAFLAALRRASHTPLAALLPDEATAHALARRLRMASAKVQELDQVLARREFSEDDALERQRQLSQAGASEYALSTVTTRLQNIRRLRVMRNRFAHELDEVGELLSQLTISAEVVRLAGNTDTEGRDLVRELVMRVEGLDQILDSDLR